MGKERKGKGREGKSLSQKSSYVFFSMMMMMMMMVGLFS